MSVYYKALVLYWSNFQARVMRNPPADVNGANYTNALVVFYCGPDLRHLIFSHVTAD